MRKKVEREKTLLVDGPARVVLISGRATIWGAPLELGEGVIVRKGKRMPLEALSSSEVELVLGDSASWVEVAGSSIPSSWVDAVGEILSTRESRIVLILGGIDSGKTSFCTYLANLGLKAKSKVALIDGDLGQSDLGPPGTVSLSLVKEPIVDLFGLRSEELIFIGITSPASRTDTILDAIETLKERALNLGANLLVINTDGWVEGDAAVSYKSRLAGAIAPHVVVAIQGEDELIPIICEIGDLRVLTIDSPSNAKKRDRETRRLLRESAYKKYLRGAKVRSYQLGWVEIEGDLRLDTERLWLITRRIREENGRDILHPERTSPEVEETERLESQSEKQAISLDEEGEEGILVALEDNSGKVLGIGTIRKLDREKGVIRVSTPVDETVSKIRIGRIKLDKEGNEIGLILGRD